MFCFCDRCVSRKSLSKIIVQIRHMNVPWPTMPAMAQTQKFTAKNVSAIRFNFASSAVLRVVYRVLAVMSQKPPVAFPCMSFPSTVLLFTSLLFVVNLLSWHFCGFSRLCKLLFVCLYDIKP